MPKAITCIDLTEKYGNQYRVELEPPATRRADHWYYTIPCRYGHIYPHGGDWLAFASNKTAKGSSTRLGQLIGLAGVELEQDGDDGFNCVFHVDLFPQVADIVLPYKRRIVPEKVKDNLRAMGRRFHFKPRRTNGTGEPENERNRGAATQEPSSELDAKWRPQ